MFFLLGYLHIELDEEIHVGDPCYINQQTSYPLTVAYKQPWLVSGSKKMTLDDLIARDKNILDMSDEDFLQVLRDTKKEVNDIIGGRLNINVYVDMQIDTMFGGQPRPNCMVLIPARDMTRNPIETDPRKYDLNEIGGAGVDSGQISVMGDKVAKQWSKPGPDEIVNERDPQNDYDACCNVTLGTQLGAGASKRHTLYNLHGYPATVTANAFATRTFYGDGYCGVYEMLDKKDKTPMGLLIDLSGDYAPPEEDDDDNDEVVSADQEYNPPNGEGGPGSDTYFSFRD